MSLNLTLVHIHFQSGTDKSERYIYHSWTYSNIDVYTGRATVEVDKIHLHLYFENVEVFLVVFHLLKVTLDSESILLNGACP
jgi:hypothetical protein